MIYDLDNNPLSSFSMSIASGDDAVLQLQLDCLSGYEFFSLSVSNIAVEARKQGDVSWTNIETTPIDLSPYNGLREIFEVRLTADVVSAINRRSFALKVEQS